MPLSVPSNEFVLRSIEGETERELGRAAGEVTSGTVLMTVSAMGRHLKGLLGNKTMVHGQGPALPGAGVFWLALVSPRNRLLDRLAPHPLTRKIIMRLPDFLQPAPERYAFVLGLDADGSVVHNLQNPSGRPFAVITSVEQVGDTSTLAVWRSRPWPALPHLEPGRQAPSARCAGGRAHW